MTFFGETRMDKHTWDHCQEQPKRTVVPIAILAVAALTIGFWNVPHFLGGHSNFTNFLDPVVHDLSSSPMENYRKLQLIKEKDQQESTAQTMKTESGHQAAASGHEAVVDHTALEWGLMIASVAWTFFTGFLAYIFYLRNPKAREQIMASALAQRVFMVLNNKYFVDEFYEAVVLTPIRKLFDFLGAFDQMVVDGLVNFAGFMGRITSSFIGIFDNEIVDGLVNGAGWGAQAGGKGASSLQSGKIQTIIGSSLIIFIIIVGCVVLFLR